MSFSLCGALSSQNSLHSSLYKNELSAITHDNTTYYVSTNNVCLDSLSIFIKMFIIGNLKYFFYNGGILRQCEYGDIILKYIEIKTDKLLQFIDDYGVFINNNIVEFKCENVILTYDIVFNIVTFDKFVNQYNKALVILDNNYFCLGNMIFKTQLIISDGIIRIVSQLNNCWRLPDHIVDTIKINKGLDLADIFCNMLSIK